MCLQRPRKNGRKGTFYAYTSTRASKYLLPNITIRFEILLRIVYVKRDHQFIYDFLLQIVAKHFARIENVNIYFYAQNSFLSDQNHFICSDKEFFLTELLQMSK